MSPLLLFAINPMRTSSQMSIQTFTNVVLVVTLENNTYGYFNRAGFAACNTLLTYQRTYEHRLAFHFLLPKAVAKLASKLEL